MFTLESIHNLLSSYAQQPHWLTGATEDEDNKQKDKLLKQIQARFINFRTAVPHLLQINYKKKTSPDEAKKLFSHIAEAVANRYSVGILPNGDTFVDKISGDRFVTPAFVNWHTDTNAHNFIINYDKDSHADATQRLHTLVMNMLLSLPSESVHLNFVDFSYIGDAAYFTKNLDKRLYRDLVVNSSGMRSLLDDMSDRMVEIFQQYGDLATYNEEKGKISIPYEVIVLIGYPDKYGPYAQDLEPLIQNGHKGGIYFVVMNDTDFKPSGDSDKEKLLIANKDKFQTFTATPINTGSITDIIRHTPIALNAELSKYAFEYLNTKAEPVSKIDNKLDYSQLITAPYCRTVDSIEVPVGVTKDGEQIQFKFNAVDHVHAFIMGQSGSGKSVLLHSIIRGVLAKYSPEELQLYLLDFKLGGVEFNAYRDMKHVKALLVDSSDQQITLEILRDISDQMKSRGKKLREAGVQNIGSYNELNPDNKMQQILLIVDECHELFKRERNNSAIANEISSIVAKISKEGRSQGVHFIMATQTMAETEISTDILRNITDHYLLRTSESFRGVPDDSTNITSSLATGQVYYHHVDKAVTFQSYYTPADVAERYIKATIDKALSSKSNGQFCFSGSQKFFVDKSVLKHAASTGGNNLVASIGRTISLDGKPVDMPLKRDDGQNLLLFGINDNHQVSETTAAILLTMLESSKKKKQPYNFYVMDFLYDDNSETPAYRKVIDDLASTGRIALVSGKECGKVLHQLANEIKQQTAPPTVLTIIGQEKFRALKVDKEIEISTEPEPEPLTDTTPGDDPFASILSGLSSFDTQSTSTDSADFKTYRKALAYILDNGSAEGVHVIIQISKPDLLLFEDNYGSKLTKSRFTHMVMFRADERSGSSLVDDSIRLDRLSDDPERPRAYYYNDITDSYTLLIPYKL